MMQAMLSKEDWPWIPPPTAWKRWPAWAEKSRPDSAGSDDAQHGWLEFAVRLRTKEEWRSIPIVVITAKDLSAEDRNRLNGGVERIIFKGSFSRDDLLRELREVLGAHKKRAH